MKITEVKITIVPNEERLKAYASIIFDNCFIINDLKVIRTNDKLFIAMPSKKHKDTFRDIAHPLDQKTRLMIQKAVFEKYKEKLNSFKSEQFKSEVGTVLKNT